MPGKKRLTVCLDANVLISAYAFGGKPLKILQHMLDRDFLHVTGTTILKEVRRNLASKMDFRPSEADLAINDIIEISSLIESTGKVRYISHKADNLVLEIAINGGCDILVTGDKKDLLPLGSLEGVIIEALSFSQTSNLDIELLPSI